MPAKKHEADDQIVRQKKLEQAIEYVTVLEAHHKRIKATLKTEVIKQLEGLNGPRLVQAITEALVPLSKEGLTDNLISSDLARICSDLGDGYIAKVSELWSKFQNNEQDVLDHCKRHPNDADAVMAAAHLADSILHLIDLMLLPARELADELISVAEKKARPTSEISRRKKIRDERIKELSIKLGTKSNAKVRDAGLKDPVIMSVCPPEPFNIETVRNLLNPRKKKKKKK